MPDKKIFVVEDEPIVAMMLEDTLAQLGYTVTGTATSGADALKKIGEIQPDLILMDIRIEGDMDGIETAEKVTSLYHLPVVYLTAHSDEKTLERAMATQPHGYLLKPFRTRELYSTIEIALYKHRLGTLGASSSPAAVVPQRERAEKTTTITLEHAVLDAMDISVFVINRDQKLVYFNSACEALFSRLGFSQPVRGRFLTDIAPHSFVGSVREYTGMLETGKESRNKISLVTDKKPASFSLLKIPLTEQGSVSYIAGIIRDITHENLLDERIKVLNANNEILLSHLGEITTLTSGKEDPAMKEIARQVSEIVIGVATLDSKEHSGNE
jgi:CheY-like chemotaxis protein